MEQGVGFEIDDSPYRRAPGPILLMAGPGTGKTHQLALRVKNLVENEAIAPDSITVITFTKEASENMRRRIDDPEKSDVYISPENRPGRITTMHSFGLEIIRTNAERLRLPEDFRVMTDSRVRRILFRDAAFLVGLGSSDAERAEHLRQGGIAPKPGDEAAEIVDRYEAILRANNAIDYDDQITLACVLLRENPDLLEKYSANCVHLLVDEYQDINPGQHELIKLLSKEHPVGLFVVGDDDQSIYSFRGGSPQYIRQFDREYGERGKILCLTQSRRCPGKVLRASLDVVRAFDPTRRAKPDPVFTAANQDAGRVKIHNTASDDQEAKVIARIVQPLWAKKRILVLIPAKQYAEKLKRQLRMRRIPYRHLPNLDESGFVLVQRVNNWRENPDDGLSLRLCIELLCNGGTVGVPPKLSRDTAKKATRQKQLKEIACLWHEVIGERISLWGALERKSTNPGTLLAQIRERLATLLQVGPKEVGEFLSIVASDLKPWRDLKSLMREIDAWLEELRAVGHQGEGGVKITTLQSAKGLEADIVCVLGLDDGILPRADAAPPIIEESARLAYVSMTRAREELHLFHARKRDGSITYLPQSFQLRRSRFLDALSKRNVEVQYYAPSKP
jgi:ATP-dependent DNA helicase UvrD/PcrA